MVASNTKNIVIEKAFSKGFVQDKARNNIPQYFAGYVRNGRIKNGGVTIRFGYTMLNNTSAGTIQGMVYTDQLYFVAGGFVYNSFNVLVSGTNIGYTGIVDFIKYGNLFIILTGIGNPRVFSQATGLFQVDDAMMPIAGTVALMDSPIIPKIGSKFTGFTFIAGNASGYKNILYISRPVIVNKNTNQPVISNSYDWSPNLPQPNNSGENRMMTSDILALESNLTNLYVFCKDTIEILGGDSFTTTGGVISLFTRPIADGDEVMNSRIVVTAGDKVLYLTNSRKVKTIGFVPGVTDPEIGDLTDRIYQCIGGFMDTLDTDQSTAFGIYVKTDNTVRRHLKTQGSSYNNICLIYDLVNDTFLVDDNKDYSCMATGNFLGVYKTFGGSGTSNRIYQDDSGTIDKFGFGAELIPFEYDTPNLSFGLPTKPKQFRGCTLGGGINQFTALGLYWYVDGDLIFSKVITYTSQIGEPLGANIGGPDISGSGFTLFPFEAVADEGEIRAKGKRIRLKIKLDPLTNNIGNVANFYLDYLSFDVRPIGPYELSDKL